MARGSRPWLLNARRKSALAAATSRFGAEQEVDSFPIAVDLRDRGKLLMNAKSLAATVLVGIL